MKKTLVTISLALATATTMFGQGRVQFNNVSGAADATVAVSIGTGGKAGEGNVGQFVGANYSIILEWAPQAVYANQAAFDAAVLGSGGLTTFFGATGGSPTTDGAGLFDAGTVPSPVGTSMPAGNYTMEALAWFNGGTFATFTAAKNGGANVGTSALLTVGSTAFPTAAPNTTFSAFTVAPVPEPTTFALAGIGAAALMIFRRRK